MRACMHRSTHSRLRALPGPACIAPRLLAPHSSRPGRRLARLSGRQLVITTLIGNLTRGREELSTRQSTRAGSEAHEIGAAALSSGAAFWPFVSSGTAGLCRRQRVHGMTPLALGVSLQAIDDNDDVARGKVAGWERGSPDARPPLSQRLMKEPQSARATHSCLLRFFMRLIMHRMRIQVRADWQ
jgi:hypothetical protein